MPVDTARLLRLVEEKLSPEGRAWFESVRAGRDVDALAASLATAGRKVAKGNVSAADAEWLSGGSLAELVRVALVAATTDLAEEAIAPLWSECFRIGDNAEKRAVLRALPFAPAREEFITLGVMGCRTNVRDVFEAIACENPFPAERFPDHNFNQMVLKALFVGVPLARVHGLSGRLSPELSRMAQGYASERRAAGRSVPEDIQKVI